MLGLFGIGLLVAIACTGFDYKSQVDNHGMPKDVSVSYRDPQSLKLFLNDFSKKDFSELDDKAMRKSIAAFQEQAKKLQDQEIK